MKRLLNILFFIIITKSLSAQKPALDTSVYNKWPSIEEVQVSNDGQYVLYKIVQGTYFQGPRQFIKLVCVSDDKHWKKEFTSIQKGFMACRFSPDSRYAVLSLPHDSLQLLQLGTDRSVYFSDVHDWSSTGKKWIGYLQENSGQRGFVLYDFTTGDKQFFPGITAFKFTQDGKKLILQEKTEDEKSDGIALRIVDINKPAAVQTIWHGKHLGNIIYDTSHHQIAFETGKQGNKSIWYCNMNKDKSAEKLITENALKNISLLLGGIDRFSLLGDRLFIKLQEKLPAKISDPVALNVWSYKDHEVQNSSISQFGGNKSAKNYDAVIYLRDKRLVQLQKKDEFPFTIGLQFGENSDNTALATFSYPAPGVAVKHIQYLVSTKNGHKKVLPEQLTYSQLSPDEKYLVYFDRKKNSFFSYNIESGVFANISQTSFNNWYYDEPGYSVSFAPSGGYIAAWDNDSTAIVYSNYDIWLIDITGKSSPVCLTNLFGEKHHIRFNLLSDNRQLLRLENKATLILRAFNTETKDNGFYRINLSKPHGNPELLTMGPYIYDVSGDGSIYDGVNHPVIKAENKDVYLVRRQSAGEYPNLYVTSDFKQFQQITDLAPERQYNWYTTELLHWINADGVLSQGVLYKAENFDPHKKYPVIFYYYTSLSDNLHSYIFPQPSDGALNIPWYVSNGYLIFTPDIHHKGKSEYQYEEATHSIVSAAKYISKLPYVDSTKMGINGISWGGIQTNYFVTHTNLFAAACSASGLGDFFSQYNGADHGNFSQEGLAQINGPGKSIWQYPQWYLKNSPVMNAPKVTTPLLMMETTADGACPFDNAFELYNALRISGKKVWMLEYTNHSEADHGVWGKSSKDFDVRMQQFFGRYLKGEPAPVWMTKGIPVRMNGRTTGLEYDTTGAKP
ncbi:S9 family peptidase [Arachidicoccus terrestris]|uniref:S9 family peptidase n=1 Tax=Arachidicoccus terrestris TaxID=2875539 RepID=UPI001CC5B775|nr:prolyl oligopeptidase family serine peptidase [Arachidicoccus terrestris]UAY55742.1 prolyl oligopeptidase family serine peptidase [Arachidicoccus terrestris]